MNAEFYLFDVDHGQCAALRLPNGRWCVFDVGCSKTFSPIRWIASRAAIAQSAFLNAVMGVSSFQSSKAAPGHLLFRNALWNALIGVSSFWFLQATVSHLHGDHLADWQAMRQYGPEFLKTVEADQAYLSDCYASCSDESSKAKVRAFAQWYAGTFSPAVSSPDYGGVSNRELALPVTVAWQLGGGPNSRVNNASVVTRIDVYGNSILLCGDMEKEGWDFVLGNQYNHILRQLLLGVNGASWKALVSNVDILVAPHHGHASAYSTELLHLAKPVVVLASVVSKDPDVDSRYSAGPVRGIRIGQTEYKLITTRKQGHIKIEIWPPEGLTSAGKRHWTFGDSALT